jgi:hypothetical protein
MSSEKPGRMDDLELAALLASAVIIAGFLGYWFVQIQDVRELLALAYG